MHGTKPELLLIDLSKPAAIAPWFIFLTVMSLSAARQTAWKLLELVDALLRGKEVCRIFTLWEYPEQGLLKDPDPATDFTDCASGTSYMRMWQFTSVRMQALRNWSGSASLPSRSFSRLLHNACCVFHRTSVLQAPERRVMATTYPWPLPGQGASQWCCWQHLRGKER